MDPAAARRLCDATADRLGLPCTDPVAFDVEPIIDRLLCHEPSARSTIASH